MKSIKMTDDEYLSIIKDHVDSLASFEEIPNFNLIAPIGEFILKAMIMDCYNFGKQHPDLFKPMLEAEKVIRSKQNISFRIQQQLPHLDFVFAELIDLWTRGSGYFLWSKIHGTSYVDSFSYSDFNQYRSLRNDASHSNRFINRISAYKQYYMLLEFFYYVMPYHVGKSYPSIADSFNEYFENKILNKKDKQLQLEEVLNKLDQLKQKHDQQPDNHYGNDNPDKMVEILNRIDFINFIDNLKKIMSDHMEGQQSKQASKKSFNKLINENNYITFLDKLNFGNELASCEVDKLYPDIDYDFIPFSSLNIEPSEELILLDYTKYATDETNCESDQPSRKEVVSTNSNDGFVSGTLGWLKKITKAGSSAVDSFLSDIKKRAEDGSAHFQNVHGALHFHGNLVSQNIDEAFNWFVASASQGYAPAQLNLGLMYLNGFKVRVDHTRAAELFLKAANQGYVQAIEALAVMHYFGEGVVKSQALAENWFLKASESGSARAQENLGIIYYKNGEYIKSEAYFIKAAKANVVTAQNLLGIIYCNCDEVRNYANAEIMFIKAIKNDCISSRISLAILYFKYGQFNKNLKDIFKILKDIATDNVEAQYCLGVMYYKNGCFEEAAKWFDLAAKKEAKALYNLGTMYFNGEGFSKSIDDALSMYSRATDNYPLANAYLSLGFIHYNGVKTQRRFEEALEYFKLAAEQGAPLADKVLAKMYFNGIGTEIDYEQFYQRSRSAYVNGEHDVLEFAQSS